jgi:predicted Fe-Mo cluster-binding NifX family protein
MAEQQLSIRVAVATGTGKRVDQHFAKTPGFDIYDVTEKGYAFIERRANPQARCGCGSGGHETDAFEAVTGSIKDCRFVVALQIGNGAITYLVDRGIRAAQIDDTVEIALQQLIDSGKLNKLIYRQGRK